VYLSSVFFGILNRARSVVNRSRVLGVSTRHALGHSCASRIVAPPPPPPPDRSPSCVRLGWLNARKSKKTKKRTKATAARPYLLGVPWGYHISRCEVAALAPAIRLPSQTSPPAYTLDQRYLLAAGAGNRCSVSHEPSLGVWVFRPARWRRTNDRLVRRHWGSCHCVRLTYVFSPRRRRGT